MKKEPIKKRYYYFNGKNIEEITEQTQERLLCKLEFETYKKLRKLENKYYNFNLYGSN